MQNKEEARLPVPLAEDINGNVTYDWWGCPNCDEEYVIVHRYHYCPNCGQHIDWEKLEKRAERNLYGE